MAEPSVRLTGGETAIVGYGSLLSTRSLEKTLKRPYNGPLVPCCIEGWRRSWDISMPNEAFYYLDKGERVYPQSIIYLNVRPVPGALMNCAIFAVGPKELAAMHQREWIYDHRVVTASLRGVRVEGGDAIIYVARPEHLLRNVTNPCQAAIRASYLRVLDEGLSRRDAAFRKEYANTTDPVPEHLVVDDVLDPDRPNPWAGAGGSR